MVREVRYDCLGWKLLLLELARGRTATLVSSGLGSEGQAPAVLALGWRVSGPSLPLSAIPQEKKGYLVPMFLELFNYLPHQSFYAQLSRLSHGSKKRLKHREGEGR